MSCSLALAAVLLSTRVAPVDTDAEFRALVRLPQWTQWFGMDWSTDSGVHLLGDTPLAREALAAARAAARKNPGDPNAQNKLYELLTRTGNHVEAAALLRQAVALRRAEVAKHPRDWKFHAALAAVLNQTGDLHAAEASARRAVALAPSESGAWYILAQSLNMNHPDEARRAIDKAAALADDDDIFTRLAQILRRLSDHQHRLDRLPPSADAAIRGAAIAQVQRSLLDTDQFLLKTTKRLKAADGTCGPDTRERCLSVMLMRDMLRAKLQTLAPTGRSGNEPDIIVSARTAKLIREITPPTSDDLVQLFAAAYLLGIAPPDAHATAGLYLRRLDELSKGKPTARAATAVFLRGVADLMAKNYPDAEARFRRAVRLVPSFDMAWRALRKTAQEADRSRANAHGAILGAVCRVDQFHTLRIARKWATKSGSAQSRYALACAMAKSGDWPAAQRIIADELKKHPDDPRLMMARAACWLRSTTTTTEFEVVSREMRAVSEWLGEPSDATRELRKEAYWLGSLCGARYGDLAAGRRYAEAYAQWAEGEDERADAAARCVNSLTTLRLRR